MHLSGCRLYITGTDNNKTKNVVMKRTFIAGALGLKRTDTVYDIAVTNFILTYLRLLCTVLLYVIFHGNSWKGNIYVNRVHTVYIIPGIHYAGKCVCSNCDLQGIAIRQTGCPLYTGLGYSTPGCYISLCTCLYYISVVLIL
jgi:hypothetical protein